MTHSAIGTLLPLSALDVPHSTFLIDSQDIASALYGAGINETDCGYSGIVEISSSDGWETLEVWATEYSRPFDLVSKYELIWRARS